MVFFSVFLRTLGFLSAVLIFLIIINILLYFSNDFQKKHFVMTDGTESSNNIIAKINLNGPCFLHRNAVITPVPASYLPAGLTGAPHSLSRLLEPLADLYLTMPFQRYPDAPRGCHFL